MFNWIKTALTSKYVLVMLSPYGDIVLRRSRFKFLLDFEAHNLSMYSLHPLKVKHHEQLREFKYDRS